MFSIRKRGKKVFWLEHEADISEMPADWFLIFARGKTTNMSLLLSAFLNFPCHHFEIVGVIPHSTQPPSLSDTKTDSYVAEAVKIVFCQVKSRAETS